MHEIKPKAQWLPLLLLITASASCTGSKLGDESAQDALQEAATQKHINRPVMQPELRTAMIAAVQSGADERFHAEPQSAEETRFRHLGQAFEANVDAKEMRLASTDDTAWNLTMSLDSVGCARAMRAVGESAVEIAKNRVNLVRDDVHEWYVNGPLGLEQGFTLNREPECAGNKVISMNLGGSMSAELSSIDNDGRGHAISFVNDQGQTIANYSDLSAKDARGNVLPTWMSVDAGMISLHIDDTGAAYPIEVDPLIWVEQVKLTTNESVPGDRFGFSLAFSGDTAVVGATGHDAGGVVDAGAAFVFVRSGTIWNFQQKLVANDADGGDQFGWSVALSGDTALVGARNATVGVNPSQGAAYVFVRNGSTWTQQAKLFAADGNNDDSFAWSVALSGDTALVGAWTDDIAGVVDQGSVYVFARNGTTWSQAQPKLTASDGKTPDSFGWSVALLGDMAFIGAPSVDVGANMNQGAAYVFTRNNGVFSEHSKLTGSAGAVKDLFGISFSLTPDTAMIGTGFANAAYAFVRNGDNWTEQQRLVASGGSIMGDYFGNAVAISGDIALVGAYGKAIGGNTLQGSAYAYVRSGGSWSEQMQLTASDGATNDQFSFSLALSGDTALVGAYFVNLSGNGAQGTVYPFLLRHTNGDACGSKVECVSGFCVDGVCCDTACGDGNTADCQACSIATGASADGACAPLAKGIECRMASDECDAAETCNGTAVECPADSSIPDGTPCAGGTCTAGVCKNETGNGGAGGGAGSGGTGGNGGNGNGAGGSDTADPSGCDCRFAGRANDQPVLGVILGLAFGILRVRRRFTKRQA